MAKNKTTILQCLMMLKAAYPRQELANETIELYKMLLRDIDPDLLKAAVLEVIASSVFFPAVAEIRGKAAELARRANGIPDAYGAWAMVQAALNGQGKPNELPAIVLDTVKGCLGEWYNLKRSTTLAADRARFIEAYQSAIRQDQTIMLPETRQYLQLAAGEDDNNDS